MSVAKVIEITAQSPESFEDAVRKGIAHAAKTVKNIKSAWVNEQSVEIGNNKVTAFRVNMRVTFIVD